MTREAGKKFPGRYRIGHVRYINILTWLRGFRVKIANFLSFFCLSIPKRDLDTKKTTPNLEVCPESLGAILEYWYIERGLLVSNDDHRLSKGRIPYSRARWKPLLKNLQPSDYVLSKKLTCNWCPLFPFSFLLSFLDAWCGIPCQDTAAWPWHNVWNEYESQHLPLYQRYKAFSSSF